MRIDILYAAEGAKSAAAVCDSFVVVFHRDPTNGVEEQVLCLNVSS